MKPGTSYGAKVMGSSFGDLSSTTTLTAGKQQGIVRLSVLTGESSSSSSQGCLQVYNIAPENIMAITKNYALQWEPHVEKRVFYQIYVYLEED